jgi:hypothetical protein
MQLLQANYDHESVALMGRVCDEVWRELQVTTFFPSAKDASEVIRQLATRVMVAVASGERNPQRLKALALEAAEA